MAEFLIGLALVLLGGAGGWALCAVYGRLVRNNRAEEPGEQERARLREDHQAFTALMGYSADTAYGLEGDHV